jgi:hydroxyacyl-ACP dehydratase HTD2-like protein with hotdog domain
LESSRGVISVATVAVADAAASMSDTVSVVVSSAVAAGVVLLEAFVVAARAACEARIAPEAHTSASSVKVPVPARGRVMATAVRTRWKALWRMG